MSDPRDTTIRRLTIRSMRRGIREMDLILSGFAAVRLASMTDAELVEYEALLSENDHDLYGWITGTIPTPARWEPLMAEITAYAQSAVRPA